MPFYIPSIGIQDDIGTIDILSKVMQAAIAGISIYIIKSSTIIWRSATTRTTSPSSSPVEILNMKSKKSEIGTKTRRETKMALLASSKVV